MSKRRQCCQSKRGKPHRDECPNARPLAAVPKEERAEILCENFGELPDGAFWALVEEWGLEPEDLL